MSVRGPRELTMDLGVFLLPLLLVKGTAIMMSEPQGASASPAIVAGAGGIGSLDDYKPEWTLQQLVAADYLEEIHELPFGPSPLLHVVKRQPVPIPNGNSAAKPPPDVTVRAIMKTRNGNVAIINRKRYQEGDVLRSDGWIVKTIDRETRSVVIQNTEDGREVTLSLPLPR